VLVEEGLGNLLDTTGLSRFRPLTTRRRHSAGREAPESLGVRLRHTLERLGPTFVKLGQVASTRPDIIPDDIIVELRKLQDDVAAFDDEEAYRAIENELGAPISELFREFERTPIASASLGQVYGAILHDGSAVCVKVQRPNVAQSVDVDLDILRTQARFVSQHSEWADRYDIVGITNEFAAAVRGELDYLAEGANCERLATTFADDTSVKFPKVYWELTTTRVLTTERLFGTPLNRPSQLAEEGHDTSVLAQRGIYCYLEQIFSQGFYHADPHPGNLFALQDDRVGFTDFGRCGSVSRIGREQLTDLFMAVIEDDAALAVDALLDAAGNPSDANATDLERDVSRLITKYYNRPLGQIRIGELVAEVLDLVRNHHLLLSSELALLLTTLGVLEGLGRQLDPTFDFVAVTAPFARKITSERMSPHSLSRGFTQSARRLIRLGQEVPESLARLLRRGSQGEFRIAVHPVGLDPLLRRVEEAANRLAFALVVASFVVGLSTLLAKGPLPVWFVWVARTVLLGALFVGSWYFVSILRAHYRHR